MASPDLDRAARAYELIRISPGINVNALSLMLGINYGAALSTLSTMANHGMLTFEDDDGRLYIYDEGEVCDGVVVSR